MLLEEEATTMGPDGQLYYGKWGMDTVGIGIDFDTRVLVHTLCNSGRLWTKDCSHHPITVLCRDNKYATFYHLLEYIIRVVVLLALLYGQL